MNVTLGQSPVRCWYWAARARAGRNRKSDARAGRVARFKTRVRW